MDQNWMKRQRELTDRLNRYRNEYYNLNSPSVSDAVYDRLFEELQELEGATGVQMANSPTNTVGYPAVSKLEKTNHSIPLLSLDKVKNTEELCRFMGEHQVMFMLKLDGLTIKLTYEGGKLVEAATRGDGDVGEIVNVNTQPILDVLEKGYIPVVSSVGCDAEGNVYNINADTMAAQISGAMGAECLISMTDVPGIMLDPDDRDSLVHVADINDATELFRQGVIKGGMIPKVESCIEALLCGVHKVFILDGRVPHSILLEMLTDEGSGTMMVGEKK